MEPDTDKHICLRFYLAKRSLKYTSPQMLCRPLAFKPKFTSITSNPIWVTQGWILPVEATFPLKSILVSVDFGGSSQYHPIGVTKSWAINFFRCEHFMACTNVPKSTVIGSGMCLWGCACHTYYNGPSLISWSFELLVSPGVTLNYNKEWMTS